VSEAWLPLRVVFSDMKVLSMARSKQLIMNVHCADPICSAVTIVRIFTDERNLLLDVPDSWQVIPRESNSMPVVTVEYRCSEHHLCDPFWDQCVSLRFDGSTSPSPRAKRSTK
jgi:hypothetical protein